MDEKSFLSKKHKREDTEGVQNLNETSEKNGDNKQEDQSSKIGSKSTKDKDNISKKENNKEPPKLFVSKIDDARPLPFEHPETSEKTMDIDEKKEEASISDVSSIKSVTKKVSLPPLIKLKKNLIKKKKN